MREIKFRGKDFKGQWIKFDLFSMNMMRVGRIELNTIGQYTGLKDKNGVEIFEGDIISLFCGTQTFVVKYCKERCGYFLDGIVLCGGAEPSVECLGNMSLTIEVIGNIYDNPELLKVEVEE